MTQFLRLSLAFLLVVSLLGCGGEQEIGRAHV